MRHWITWIAATCLGLVLVTWLVLDSSLLAGVRGKLVETMLARKIGGTVQIDGGVWIDPGETLNITAEGLVVAGPSGATPPLASVDRIAFDLPFRALIGGSVEPRDIRVSGATVTLPVISDATQPGKGANRAIRGALRFLADHDISVSDSGIAYRDPGNGLDLDLRLTMLQLGQSADGVSVQGKGALNGQDVTLSGGFSDTDPFTLEADFGEVDVKLAGTPGPDGIAGGYAAELSATVSDINRLMAILKLSGDIDGEGTIRVSVRKSGDGGTASGNLAFDLTTGESLRVDAVIGDLSQPRDSTIKTRLRLYPKGKEPEPTRIRRDLKLVGVDMDLTSRPGQEPLRAMVITTNGFVLDTGGVGPPPISVSEISRTRDGKLRIGKAELRIGPPDSPLVMLEGVIGDLLALQGFDFDGRLDSPGGNLIAPERLQTDTALGRLSGVFKLAGDTRVLSLSGLDLELRDTSLWSLKTTGSVENILKFDTVTLDIAARIASVPAFLKALDLAPGNELSAALDLTLSSHDTEWGSSAKISIDRSELRADLSLQADAQHPTVRGKINSDLIRVSHLRDIINASIELSQLDRPAAPQKHPASGSEGPLRDVTLQPIGQAILLSDMDVDIKIDLDKIEMAKGQGSIHSELVVVDHKAKLGPVKFFYGGGHFDVSAAMDMAKAPGVLGLKGSTGGWDFAHVLEFLKFKKHASGILDASFDVSGEHASVRRYFKTLSGSGMVSMRNGSIDSQLLDLAGLGVIPWLFEKDRKKTAVIVCLRAPLSASNGRFVLRNGVVETPRVQVVLNGDVNLRDDRLDLDGQPRRIGKPLSRSPWPFKIEGPIKHPKVRVGDGPRRLRRSDGASRMPARRKTCVPDILQLK
ncbi:AsmA-like C-terminal region-containing protein [Microbulbifer sp. S227A]|uniref:AsmA family protein n=1 Tax=Microbulbifer sp. S227A TaxID=3415131 RepID=UPI003C7AAFD0